MYSYRRKFSVLLIPLMRRRPNAVTRLANLTAKIPQRRGTIIRCPARTFRVARIWQLLLQKSRVQSWSDLNKSHFESLSFGLCRIIHIGLNLYSPTEWSFSADRFKSSQVRVEEDVVAKSHGPFGAGLQICKLLT